MLFPLLTDLFTNSTLPLHFTENKDLYFSLFLTQTYQMAFEELEYSHMYHFWGSFLSVQSLRVYSFHWGKIARILYKNCVHMGLEWQKKNIFYVNYPFKSLILWQTDVMLLPSQCHNKMQQKQMGSMNRLRMRICPAGMAWLHASVPHILPHGLQWLWPVTHQPPSPPVLIMEEVHVILAHVYNMQWLCPSI